MAKPRPIDVMARRASVVMVSDELLIRRATPIDVDGAVMLDPQGRRAPIDASFTAGNGWVAQRSGGMLAFALVTDHFYGRPFIDLLVVREQVRRTGIGRALVSAIVREHHGARVFTSTNESNVAMQRLLEGMGFTAAGVIHGLDRDDPELVFYIDGE